MDNQSQMVIELNWPPSVNQYWRRNGNRYFISQGGKNFREHVHYSCLNLKGFFSKEDRLSLIIHAYPPDKRRRDLDNILKSLLDSLQHAEIYHDDNQIDEILIRRQPLLLNKVRVMCSKINES